MCTQQTLFSLSLSFHCKKGILRTEYYVNALKNVRWKQMEAKRDWESLYVDHCGGRLLCNLIFVQNPNIIPWHEQEIPIEFRCVNKVKKTQRGIFLQINSLNKFFFLSLLCFQSGHKNVSSTDMNMNKKNRITAHRKLFNSLHFVIVSFFFLLIGKTITLLSWGVVMRKPKNYTAPITTTNDKKTCWSFNILRKKKKIIKNQHDHRRKNLWTWNGKKKSI